MEKDKVLEAAAVLARLPEDPPNDVRDPALKAALAEAITGASKLLAAILKGERVEE